VRLDLGLMSNFDDFRCSSNARTKELHCGGRQA
jgi:hypothetical protein